ncbi:alpha-D-xyloside xylohydrolase [Mucilaginibacter yixingensis]|uniref:Alpha-D-xyloside xylohydrolase n=1 Tax=Mucilaginibacter yixingensis TaxID=1295612 RepID=A0A2T5J8R3_9SPHI|nr:TIM-barrel domain-containing protein [Mucilaginibacter yixingensis]PTQ95789.1 alpha-D-xyloside xylohydrolase [Mucilaginibacter yixingensis]
MPKFYRRVLAVCLPFLLAHYIAGAQIESFSKNQDGVSFKLKEGLMQINVCTDDIIRVRYTVLDNFPQVQSLVVNNAWKQRPAFTLNSNGKSVFITTKKLKITIDKITNAITYANTAGQQICAESPTGNKSMQPATIAGIATYNCQTQFNSPANEGLFGLGCHPLDSLSINYKGRNQDLAIKYLTGAIPVLLSTRGYGLLWDNYSASNFYGAEDGNTRFKYVSESGRMVDYYFFYGPDFDRIINLYRTATGTTPMFPKWAYGLFQSQDRYKTQAEVLSVKDNYRKNHIPVDAIVQDWYYWEPLPIGSHIMKPERYPDPKAMVSALHQANIHAMISIWPVFGKGTANFDALKKNGFLTDITWDNVMTHTFDTYYDAHNPKARDLYWQQARDSMIKRYDWDAWWVDQCEPDNGALLDARRQANFSVGKGIDYFNTYSLEHTKGLYKGWREDMPGKRAFFLVRQAFAGQQRNATTLWSSDITCTFEAFKCQVPQGINACTSGMPYWTSDIGGYHYKWNAPNWAKPENRELFTRWFQFGAFCPIFRIHGKGERALFSDNWDADTKAILLKFDQLRYRLLPYIYSVAGSVTQDNYTMMRSLAFDFRNDQQVYDIKDQYLFGPALMVCPVTDQLYTRAHAVAGAKSRKVYLPAGTQWYNFWTGQTLRGGQTLQADAPIDILPLYVRSGSIIPMGPVVEYATQKTDEPTELRIYPGANGQFKVYEDENDNYNYEQGRSATYTFNWNDQLKTLSISATKGWYKGMPKQHRFKVVIVKPGHGVAGEETAQTDKLITYSGQAIQVKF